MTGVVALPVQAATKVEWWEEATLASVVLEIGSQSFITCCCSPARHPHTNRLNPPSVALVTVVSASASTPLRPRNSHGEW